MPHYSPFLPKNGLRTGHILTVINVRKVKKRRPLCASLFPDSLGEEDLFAPRYCLKPRENRGLFAPHSLLTHGRTEASLRLMAGLYLRVYYTHHATRVVYLRCTIPTMLPVREEGYLPICLPTYHGRGIPLLYIPYPVPLRVYLPP